MPVPMISSASAHSAMITGALRTHRRAGDSAARQPRRAITKLVRLKHAR